jgi:hypothetical protein
VKLEAFLVLSAVIAATGCGDSGGQRLSREEYASKADAICRQYGEEASALTNPTTVAELVTVLDKQLPILEKALDGVHRLKPPESEQATVDQWLANEDKIKADLEELRDKAKANDLQGVRAVEKKVTRDNHRVNQLATTLGMTLCNQG